MKTQDGLRAFVKAGSWDSLGTHGSSSLSTWVLDTSGGGRDRLPATEEGVLAATKSQPCSLQRVGRAVSQGRSELRGVSEWILGVREIVQR